MQDVPRSLSDLEIVGCKWTAGANSRFRRSKSDRLLGIFRTTDRLPVAAASLVEQRVFIGFNIDLYVKK